MNQHAKEQLRKQLSKEYWRQGQHLYIASIEVMDERNSCLSIYTFDKTKREFGTYLFDIQNYNNFFGLERHPNGEFYQPFDVDRASCAVGYLDKVYTLPTFKNITEEDIEKKARIFVNKELDCFFFNFEFLNHLAIEKLQKPKLIYDERYFIKI